MESKKFFLLYKCGVWKNNAELLCVCGDEDSFIDAVARHIECGDMEYQEDYRKFLTGRNGADLFRKEYETLSFKEVDVNLKYGIMATAYDGEDILNIYG